jgi:hypothetical protein
MQISKESNQIHDNSSNDEDNENYTLITVGRTSRKITADSNSHRLKTQQDQRVKGSVKKGINDYIDGDNLIGHNSEELEASHLKTRPCTSNTHYKN